MNEKVGYYLSQDISQFPSFIFPSFSSTARPNKQAAAVTTHYYYYYYYGYSIRTHNASQCNGHYPVVFFEQRCDRTLAITFTSAYNTYASIS